MATILAVHADGHPGSTLGLCPPSVQLDDEGTYYASRGQRWLYTHHSDYWDEIKRRKEEGNAVVITVLNGDSVDRNYHSTFQRVSYNPTDIKAIATAVYERPAMISDYLFVVRGTAAHCGRSGWLEEWLAEDLSAVRDEEADRWSWWYVQIEVEGLLVEFYHTPETSGRLPHTENAAASRMSSIVFQRAHECGEQVPDLCFFSHVHYPADSGIARKPRVIYTPGWQLPYDWVHGRGKGRRPQPIGGVIATVDNGHADVEFFMKRPKGRVPWTPPTESIASQRTS